MCLRCCRNVCERTREELVGTEKCVFRGDLLKIEGSPPSLRGLEQRGLREEGEVRVQGLETVCLGLESSTLGAR